MEDGLETGTGVEITGIMLEQMGQPQNGMPFIHVAGTNGKGSVCAFLTSVFREAGLKVGTFISPHLIDFEERIMVDGRQISREDVTRIGNVLLEQEFGVTPTMFDYCVLMAVLYFKEQNCDLVIMETVLGGRLDSTNALGNPVVSVITRIGYDHMNILGNTIEEIAQEKAGIIKAGVPVVIAPQESEALAVLQRALQQREYVRGVYRRMTCRGQRQYSRDFWVLIREKTPLQPCVRHKWHEPDAG